MTKRFPLHIHISTLFLMLVVVTGTLIGGVGYKLSRDILEATATDMVARVNREISGELEQIISPAEMALNLVSHSNIVQAHTLEERMAYLPLLRTVLDGSNALSSVYIGYDDGDFLFVRHVHDEGERAVLKAPEGTKYILQSIERNTVPPRGRYIYLDADFKPFQTDDRADYVSAYDPRSRVWFQEASRTEKQIKTAPYLFFSNQKIGMTLAVRSHQGLGVVGEDILLETLSDSLQRQKITPGTQIVLINGEGGVLAHENIAQFTEVKNAEGIQKKVALAKLQELGIPVLAEIAKNVRYEDTAAVKDMRISDGLQSWHASVTPLQLEGAAPLYLVTAIPDHELLGAAFRLRTTAVLITALIILISIPVTWWIARIISKSLRALTSEAESIYRFEFSDSTAKRAPSMVLEVDELSHVMEQMKRTIRRFLDINMLVAAEENFDQLLPKLLREVLSISHAQGGVLYLNGPEGLTPVSALLANGTPLPGMETGHLQVLNVQAVDTDSHQHMGPLMSHAIHKGTVHESILKPADVTQIGLDRYVTLEEISRQPYHAIAVPLLNRQHQLVGAMLLLIGEEACDDARVSFVAALSGSTAITLETRELIKSQKELFEAFIQLIASAIDAKSPYTGGHCARVPELTKMLARAACDTTTGPFKNFTLNPDEWEAVHIAAWLHDCGKVTTPEYVVDKSTKLETLYNRIHEIRMRFELLKREAEIQTLNTILAGGDPQTARDQLKQRHQQLDDDYTFLATCNQGGEMLAPDKLQRLKTIAAHTWTRTLDDRIGLSHEELQRKKRTPAPQLPVTEPLLADKEEHLIERRTQDRIPADNKWGFNMLAPEHLYNQGELYNLSITRGTLTAEERYKINEHIIQTLIMLDKLPFPKHLRNVPEIAGGHHEKMDGSGYPKGLKKEDMSPVARMMAIADIFEALTAIDRPYKEGKTLSESLKIMAGMRDGQHIDPDLFDLFLNSGAYLQYARQYMRPEQIDAVDIEKYLSPSAVERGGTQ